MHNQRETPRQEEIKRLIEESGAVRRGHFELASGRHSDTYVEKFRVLEKPKLLRTVCEEIASHFQGVAADIVVAPSTGGMMVGLTVADILEIDVVYVEQDSGGKRVLRRGGHIASGARALLVDDVLTTGVSLFEVLNVPEVAKAKLVGVGVLIDRSERPIDFGVDFFAASRFEARSYDPADVPDWLAQIPLDVPGTRAKFRH